MNLQQIMLRCTQKPIPALPTLQKTRKALYSNEGTISLLQYCVTGECMYSIVLQL